MQYRKCNIDIYVNFLIGSQKQYSALELAKVSPDPMAHDSVSRWLSQEKLTPKVLWTESQYLIKKEGGSLVIDDSVLDKPYSREIPLVKKQYSGKHHRPVKGIDIVNVLWTDGEKMIPIDYRVYDPTRDGKTKNDHAREMLGMAKKRELKPQDVLMDAWFTSIGNLKAIEAHGWKWIGEIKCNRQVSVKKGEYVRVENLDWASKQVHRVWLKAYGFIVVSKIVAPNGDIAYIATNDLSLEDAETIKTILPIDGRSRLFTEASSNVVVLKGAIPHWSVLSETIFCARSWLFLSWNGNVFRMRFRGMNRSGTLPEVR